MSKKWLLPLFLAPVFCLAELRECEAQQKGAPVATHRAHSSHGPHGGELLEIGKNEFHAELVVDEAKKQLVIYLLEADAATNLAIEAPYLTANLIIAGKPMQIQLKAIPQATDAQGLSSCFGAISPELMDALHSAKAEPKLASRIRNKSYVTKLVHKHDHAGHNHAQQPVPSPIKKR